MTVRRALPAFAILLLAVGCGGGSPYVPRTTLQTQLMALEQGKKLPYTVGAAACPASVPDRVGATASCTIDFDGVAVPIDLEVVGTGGGAQISAMIPVPVLKLDEAQQVLVARAEGLTGAAAATADCESGNGGKPLLVSSIGATFECSVTSGGSTQTVTLKVNDLSGSVAIVTPSPSPSPTG